MAERFDDSVSFANKTRAAIHVPHCIDNQTNSNGISLYRTTNINQSRLPQNVRMVRLSWLFTNFLMLSYASVFNCSHSIKPFGV
jgi:hypothetical protein